MERHSYQSKMSDMVYDRFAGKPRPRNVAFEGDNNKRYTLLAACDVHGFILQACELIEQQRSADDNDRPRTLHNMGRDLSGARPWEIRVG
jgi:hypothetical protein